MFVVCGEALMDVYANGSTLTGMALDARIGGSPLNVAIGLSRMQQPVCFFSAVSRDFLGDRLMQAIEQEGVGTVTVTRSESPTTLSMVGLDAKGVPSYAFHGDHGADRQLPASSLASLPAHIAAVHFGSYATVVEPVASTLRVLVERVQGRALIAYDPNVRLNVEPDIARWQAHVEWMMPRTTLLKISDEDLGLISPGETPDAFAARAIAQGVSLVVVTCGGRGSLGFTAQTQAQAAQVPVAVVDTVGAGDTFQSGLLTWLAEGARLDAAALRALSADQLHDALQFAGTAASIVCGRRGADMPRRNELPARRPG